MLFEEVATGEPMERVLDERLRQVEGLGHALGWVPDATRGRARVDEQEHEDAQVRRRQAQRADEVVAADAQDGLGWSHMRG